MTRKCIECIRWLHIKSFAHCKYQTTSTLTKKRKVLAKSIWRVLVETTVYPKAAKRSIPCVPLLSLNDSTVMIAAAELLAYK